MFSIPIKLDGLDLEECTARMEKGEYFEAKIDQDKVELKFTPNNCTFKSNVYADLLIL